MPTGVYPRKPVPAAERFWSKVDKSGDCWIWTAGHDHHGYGNFKVGHHKSTKAHRVVWQFTYGEIPKGMCILHRCDNPPCVRLDHLFVGTKADNRWDCVLKGRHAFGEHHSQAKLLRSEVEEIRYLREKGMILRELSLRFGVCINTIWLICTGKTWLREEKKK